MKTNNNQNDDGVLQEINRVYFIAAGISLLFLVTIYFVIARAEPPEESMLFTLRMFFLDLLGEFIPMSLLIVGAFIFVRRIEAKKSEKTIEEIINKTRADSNVFGNGPTHINSLLQTLPEETIINIYFQQTSDIRNNRKREILSQSRGRIQLLAHSGNSYLSTGNRFYGEVVSCLNRPVPVDVKVILLNPWSFTGFTLALGEIQKNDPLLISRIRDQLLGKTISTDFDPVKFVQNSDHFAGKFTSSIEGYKRLRERFGNRIEVKLVNYDIAATILITEEIGFFEPYVNVNLYERFQRRLHTFEVEYDSKSYLADTCQGYFNSLWDMSISYEEYIEREEDFKKSLRNMFTYGE